MSWRAQPPEPAPIRPYAAPLLEIERLDNGMRCATLRHGDVPVVTATVVLDAGAMHDPADRTGLAWLVAGALDAGAAGRDADALAIAFERLGAHFETAASWDALRVEVTVAADRLEPALALLADVVRRPDFPEDEVARLRDEQRAELLQRLHEPRALASDMAARFIYAEGSRYGRPILGEPAHVARISRDDAAGFHRRHCTPAGAALLLAGDVAEDAAAEFGRRFFGDWQGPPAAAAHIDTAQRLPAPLIHLVHRPGAVQSEIRAGHPGLPRRHPDHEALEVVNTLFGAAFTSRLNMNLRERHGFTYGVHSGFAWRRFAGPFSIQTAVATDVTAAAVREILTETARLLEDGPAEDEVASARDYLAGVLPLALQTTEQLARAAADIIIHDLGGDYLRRHARDILAVPLEAARDAARRHIRTDRMVITIVGDADRIAAELETLDFAPVVRTGTSAPPAPEAPAS
jgi:zinc protease